MADYYSNTSVVYRLHLGIWVNSQDVANNRTNLGYYLDFENTGSSAYSAHNDTGENFYLSIHGQVVFNSSVTWSLGGGQKKRICSGSLNVTHHDDGTLDVGCEFRRTSNSSAAYYPASLSGWADYFLPTIPRASSISSSPTTQTFGNALSLTISRATSAFTHTLRYSYGGTSGTIATGVGTSYSWTPPTSLAAKTPNAVSNTLTIYCDTYNGSTKIGTKSCTVTMNAPSSWVPTISGVSVSDAMTGKPSAMSGMWIQGKSKPKITAASGSGSNGSTLSSWAHVMEGVTYSGQTPQLNTIKGSGSITISTTVTDSRGRKSAAKSTTLTVQPYANPTITKFSAVRSTDGVADDEGTQAKFEVSWAVSSVTSKNACSVKVQRQTSSGWVDVASVASPAYSGTATLTTASDVTLSVDESFIFRALVTDSFTSAQAQTSVSSSYTLINYGHDGESIGIGKMAHNDRTYRNALTKTYAHATSASGSGGYLKILRIKIAAQAYNYGGIEFKYHCGAFNTSWFDTGKIVINGSSTTDPTPSVIVCSNPKNPFWLYKAAANTWDVYVPKQGTEQAFVFGITQFRVNKLSWEFMDEQVSALPSGCYRAKWEHLDTCFPVGIVIESVSSTNPGSYLGGTWVQDLQGRSPIGVGTGSDGTTSKTFSASSTGGEYTHKLTIAEMPSHTHGITERHGATLGNYAHGPHMSSQSGNNAVWGADNTPIAASGGGGSHNNIQPYKGLYFWRRTA